MYMYFYAEARCLTSCILHVFLRIAVCDAGVQFDALHVPLPLAEMMCMSENDDATNAGAANAGVCVDHV